MAASIIIGILSALGGLVVGALGAGRWIGSKETTIDQQEKKIEGVKEEVKHGLSINKDDFEKMLREMRRSVCDGFKIALADERLRQEERHTEHATQIAMLLAKVDVHDDQIAEIFNRINNRHHDYGRPEGERRTS